MKIKKSLTVAIIYVIALLLSYGVFSFIFTRNASAETHEHLFGCSGEENVPQNTPTAYATNTTYNTYLEAYFENLTENFGYNYKGSCGYIALGMILSYYDNYFTDDVISERYDVRSEGLGTNMINRHNSPGVMNDNFLYDEIENDEIENEEIEKGEKISAQKYYNYLLDYENYSFHAKLILLADTLKHTYNFNNDDEPCLSTMSDMMYVARYYLYNIRGFSPLTNFSVKVNKDDNEENVKKFIRDEIDRGFPVFTCIESKKGIGHAVVAYDYDSNGEIYFHTGWHGYGTRQTVTSISYKKIYRAAAVEFYIKADEHKHTDNYEVIGGDESDYYCYCSDKIVTYKHTEHNYNCKYEKINADTHKAYCICENYSILNHAYNERCKSVSAEKHSAYCKCGASAEVKHFWRPYSNPLYSPGQYVQCKFCGFVKKSTGDQVALFLQG